MYKIPIFGQDFQVKAKKEKTVVLVGNRTGSGYKCFKCRQSITFKMNIPKKVRAAVVIQEGKSTSYVEVKIITHQPGRKNWRILKKFQG